MVSTILSTAHIRKKCSENSKTRERDLADNLGISEAQLVAAHCGFGSTRIDAHPDRVIQLAQSFGEVMGLTRNASCVHEKIGCYENYHPGNHAAMVLNEDIDLRIFPNHWQHAFLVEKQSETAVKRSLQVFDSAGDAVHKIFLNEDSNAKAFADAVTQAAVSNQSDALDVLPRTVPEGPKSREDKVDILRSEWQRLTDTHQFLRLVSKLKMNRLGAYRIAGEQFAVALEPSATVDLLKELKRSNTEVILFVGNKGCIQIHTGAIEMIKPMGPWQNVLDPRFNLHLRQDHVSEVWLVHKPTQRGMATSVEAFDARGSLIFQVFGVPKEGRNSRPAFRQITESLNRKAS